MHRRIMGVETEYGILHTPADPTSARMGPDEVARTLFRPVVEQHASSNIFALNGARLYLDVGSHPEYATPECDSVAQLLVYDRAGDELFNDLSLEAEQRLHAGGLDGQVLLFRNNVDSVGNSYGCHENYLVSRMHVLKTLGTTLLPFLVTRQLIAGAGMISTPLPGARGEHTYEYLLSQRADHVWDGVSSATTRSRPMINTRDEPHADSHLYRRLHVIVGDSTMAEPTTALKICSTLMVLEMLESGWSPRNFELDNGAIKDIARNPRLGLEVQRYYYDAARAFFNDNAQGVQVASREHQTHSPEPLYAYCLDLWGRTLDAIDSGDYSTIDTEIDWAIKLSVIRAYQNKLGLHPEDFTHPQLKQIDLRYHDIRPGRGLARALESKGRIRRLTDPHEVDRAKTYGPTTTRAHLRSRFLHAAAEYDAAVGVEWMRLKVTRPEPRGVELGDPFANDNADVDALIDYMRAPESHG